jgi:hypothetical protein
MATSVLTPFELDNESACVLAAYERDQQQAAESAVAMKRRSTTTDPSLDAWEAREDDSAAGWVPRLGGLDGVPPERLAPLHGRLIALGLLRFQLLDRTGGMVYRISHEGRSLLAAARGEPAAPVDSSGDELIADDAAQAEAAA